ncbi:MAG TPA: hypothetical protein VGT61_08655 [Thermomicrobiales bacterium]|jgi:hypothetical protein|nr:hypothetical protein [Thermomicrobiales bacterium]
MSTYSLYRGANRTDTLADTITTARDKYLARHGRSATTARVSTLVAEALGPIAGLVIVPDVRVQVGEVWLTDEERHL